MMSTLRPVGPVAFENSRGKTAPKNRLEKESAPSGVKEKTYQQPLVTPRKALNPLQNTNQQNQQATSQLKPTVSITTKPSAQKPSQQNLKPSKKTSKTKPVPTNTEHDKEEYPEIENIHLTDPLKMELEDLPFTTPDYIFNLQNWKPRLFSVHRKGPGIKDDNTSWNDYSYEPLESVNPSTTTDKEDWSLPFDVPALPDISDLDVLKIL